MMTTLQHHQPIAENLENQFYFQVPLKFCKENGIRVGRVPSYSPSSIAEYAISSIMALAKNIQKSYELTKDADFTIGGLQCVLIEDKVKKLLSE